MRLILFFKMAMSLLILSLRTNLVKGADTCVSTTKCEVMVTGVIGHEPDGTPIYGPVATQIDCVNLCYIYSSGTEPCTISTCLSTCTTECGQSCVGISDITDSSPTAPSEFLGAFYVDDAAAATKLVSIPTFMSLSGGSCVSSISNSDYQIVSSSVQAKVTLPADTQNIKARVDAKYAASFSFPYVQINPSSGQFTLPNYSGEGEITFKIQISRSSTSWISPNKQVTVNCPSTMTVTTSGATIKNYVAAGQVDSSSPSLTFTIPHSYFTNISPAGCLVDQLQQRDPSDNAQYATNHAIFPNPPTFSSTDHTQNDITVLIADQTLSASALTPFLTEGTHEFHLYMKFQGGYTLTIINKFYVVICGPHDPLNDPTLVGSPIIVNNPSGINYVSFTETTPTTCVFTSFEIREFDDTCGDESLDSCFLAIDTNSKIATSQSTITRDTSGLLRLYIKDITYEQGIKFKMIGTYDSQPELTWNLETVYSIIVECGPDSTTLTSRQSGTFEPILTLSPSTGQIDNNNDEFRDITEFENSHTNTYDPLRCPITNYYLVKTSGTDLTNYCLSASPTFVSSLYLGKSTPDTLVNDPVFVQSPLESVRSGNIAKLIIQVPTQFLTYQYLPFSNSPREYQIIACATGGAQAKSPLIRIQVGCGNEVYKDINFGISPHDNIIKIFDRTHDGNTSILIQPDIVRFETDTTQCPHYQYRLVYSDPENTSKLPSYLSLIHENVTNSTGAVKDDAEITFVSKMPFLLHLKLFGHTKIYQNGLEDVINESIFQEFPFTIGVCGHEHIGVKLPSQTAEYIYLVVNTTKQVFSKQLLDQYYRLTFGHVESSDQCTIKDYNFLVTPYAGSVHWKSPDYEGEVLIKYTDKGLEINTTYPMHMQTFYLQAVTRGFITAQKKVEIEVCGSQYILNPVPEAIYPLTIHYGFNGGKYMLDQEELILFYFCTSKNCKCSITDIHLQYQTNEQSNTFEVLSSSSIYYDKKLQGLTIDSTEPQMILLKVNASSPNNEYPVSVLISLLTCGDESIQTTNGRAMKLVLDIYHGSFTGMDALRELINRNQIKSAFRLSNNFEGRCPIQNYFLSQIRNTESATENLYLGHIVAPVIRIQGTRSNSKVIADLSPLLLSESYLQDNPDTNNLPPAEPVFYLGAITSGQKVAYKEIQLEIIYPWAVKKLTAEEEQRLREQQRAKDVEIVKVANVQIRADGLLTMVFQKPLVLREDQSSGRSNNIKFEDIFSCELLANDEDNLKSSKIVSFDNTIIKVQLEFYVPEKISVGDSQDILLLTPKKPSIFDQDLSDQQIYKGIPPLLPEGVSYDDIIEQIDTSKYSSFGVILISFIMQFLFKMKVGVLNTLFYLLQLISILDIYQVMLPAISKIWLNNLQDLVSLKFMTYAGISKILFNRDEMVEEIYDIEDESRSYQVKGKFFNNLSGFFNILFFMVIRILLCLFIEKLFFFNQWFHLQVKNYRIGFMNKFMWSDMINTSMKSLLIETIHLIIGFKKLTNDVDIIDLIVMTLCALKVTFFLIWSWHFMLTKFDQLTEKLIEKHEDETPQLEGGNKEQTPSIKKKGKKKKKVKKKKEGLTISAEDFDNFDELDEIIKNPEVFRASIIPKEETVTENKKKFITAKVKKKVRFQEEKVQQKDESDKQDGGTKIAVKTVKKKLILRKKEVKKEPMDKIEKLDPVTESFKKSIQARLNRSPKQIYPAMIQDLDMSSDQMKYHGKMKGLFWPIHLLKRVLVAMIPLLIFPDHPAFQIQWLSSLQFVYTCYLIQVKPFASKLTLYIHIIQEICLQYIIFTMMILLFVDPYLMNQRNVIGLIQQTIVCLIGIINLASLVKSVYKSIESKISQSLFRREKNSLKPNIKKRLNEGIYRLYKMSFIRAKLNNGIRDLMRKTVRMIIIKDRMESAILQQFQIANQRIKILKWEKEWQLESKKEEPGQAYGLKETSSVPQFLVPHQARKIKDSKVRVSNSNQPIHGTHKSASKITNKAVPKSQKTLEDQVKKRQNNRNRTSIMRESFKKHDKNNESQNFLNQGVAISEDRVASSSASEVDTNPGFEKASNSVARGKHQTLQQPPQEFILFGDKNKDSSEDAEDQDDHRLDEPCENWSRFTHIVRNRYHTLSHIKWEAITLQPENDIKFYGFGMFAHIDSQSFILQYKWVYDLERSKQYTVKIEDEKKDPKYLWHNIRIKKPFRVQAGKQLHLLIKLASKTSQANKFFYGLRDFRAANRELEFKHKVFKVKESIYNQSDTDEEYGQLPFVLYQQLENEPRHHKKRWQQILEDIIQ